MQVAHYNVMQCINIYTTAPKAAKATPKPNAAAAAAAGRAVTAKPRFCEKVSYLVNTINFSFFLSLSSSKNKKKNLIIFVVFIIIIYILELQCKSQVLQCIPCYCFKRFLQNR
jgi:hypothetical protein